MADSLAVVASSRFRVAVPTAVLEVVDLHRSGLGLCCRRMIVGGFLRAGVRELAVAGKPVTSVFGEADGGFESLWSCLPSVARIVVLAPDHS